MIEHSISFSTTPSFKTVGGQNVSLFMVTWEDHEIISSKVILEMTLDQVHWFDGKDPLAWAEHLCDEIYKGINAARAKQMDTGWISGSMSAEQEPSEDPSLGM